MAAGQTVGYVRVSTVDQNPERQLDGIQCEKLFVDKASGKDVDRPQLQAALAYVREGDTLVIHSLDRLARNAEDLLRLVRELTSRGVTVRFEKNNLTFRADSDAMGRLMLTMLAGFAEFERDLIRERQREGIALAKARGAYKGRPRALDSAKIDEARKRLTEGETLAAVARHLKVSRQTLYTALAERTGS